MKYPRIAIALAMTLAVAACGWRRTPVPIVSETGSTALLVGSWAGEYSSPQTGRSGSISFDLASEKDTAYCDVVMIPKAQTFRITSLERPDVPLARPEILSEPLRIRFIRLGEGRLTGTLEPYTDPECGCKVTTTFQGRFTSQNVIEGTYTTKSEGVHQETAGRWKVTRETKGVATK
jgi:hypothetical protein